MDNPYIWYNLLVGIETMLRTGVPYDAVRELRIVFTKALEENRISQQTLDQFDKFFEE